MQINFLIHFNNNNKCCKKIATVILIYFSCTCMKRIKFSLILFSNFNFNLLSLIAFDFVNLFHFNFSLISMFSFSLNLIFLFFSYFDFYLFCTCIFIFIFIFISLNTLGIFGVEGGRFTRLMFWGQLCVSRWLLDSYLSHCGAGLVNKGFIMVAVFVVVFGRTSSPYTQGGNRVLGCEMVGGCHHIRIPATVTPVVC